MKKLKYTALAAMIASVPYMPANAAKFESFSGYKENRAITGYKPYFEKIGASVDPSAIENIAGEDVAVIKVGTKLQVKFNDIAQVEQKDGDNDDQISDLSKYMIVWFALGDGTEDDAYWQSRTGWNDIATKEPILEIDANAVVTENGLSTLYVPAGAVGKRIGFIAVPETETGRARRGNPVYVWNIAKYFGQPEVTDPGLPPINPIDPENPGDKDPTNPNPETPIYPNCPPELDAGPDGCGEAGGPNTEIPVPDPEVPPVIEDGQVMLAMVIKDLDRGKTTDDADFDFLVNTRYQATLKFDNGRPFTQEMLDAPGATVQWIAYRLAEGADADVCKADNIDDRNNPSCFTREEVPALTATVDVDGNLVTTYTTQATNADAKGNLKNLAPDYSEQGYWLEVEFDDGL